MIIQLHVSRQKAIYLRTQGFYVEHLPGSGVVTIDTDTVTDDELLNLKVARANLPNTQPRDLAGEFDDLVDRVKKIEET